MQPSDARFELQLLGSVTLVNPNGQRVAFPCRKALLVLAVLVEAGATGIRRSVLAESVWPDAPQEKARASLRNMLPWIARTLGPDGLKRTKHEIRLNPTLIGGDWLNLRSSGEYTGDFMPGYTEDWAIERRLELRSRASELALAEARTADDPLATEALLQRATTIDPWSQEAAAAQVEFLTRSGNNIEATRTADRFRSRILKDLGLLPEVSSVSKSHEVEHHPLIESAEWLMDHTPSDAVKMLAATSSSWLSMPIEKAKSLMERGLAQHGGTESERMRVKAHLWQIKVMQGQVGTPLAEVERALERTLEAGESVSASRISSALAYGNLSRGEFRAAMRCAKNAVSMAKLSADKTLQVEMKVNLAIMISQLGKEEQAFKMFEALGPEVEEHGTPQMLSGYLTIVADGARREGRFDIADARITRAKRILESCGASRSWQWILLTEATLLEGLGELGAAREKCMRVLKIGPEVGGQAVIAVAGEQLARIEVGLKEYVSAAEFLGKVSAYRKTVGSVPSITERHGIRKIKQVLGERLDARELRAAYYRSQSTNS